MMGSREPKARTGSRDCLRRFVLDMKGLWFSWGVIIALINFAAVPSVLSPLIIRTLIDRALAELQFSLFLWLTLALVGLYVLQLTLWAARDYLQKATAQRAILKLRIRLFGKLTRMRRSFYLQHPGGELISRLESDVTQAEALASHLLAATLSEGLMVLYALVAMAILNIYMCLSVLSAFPLLLMVQKRYSAQVRSTTIKSRQAQAGLLAVLQETLLGLEWIQNVAGEKRAGKRYLLQARQVIARQLEAARIAVLVSSGLGLNGIVIAMIAYGLGGYFVLIGVFTIGTLIAFKSYLDRFTTSLSVVAQLWVDAERSLACLERVYWLLDHPDELKRGGRQPRHIAGRIQCRDVSLSSAGQPILSRLNMDIDENEFVAVVGPNGSGKSTVVNLLLRQVDPDAGEIRLDEHPLSQYDPVSLRRRIGIVSDRHFFFFSTVRDNLIFMKPNASKEELSHALEQVGLGQWIRGLPDGFDTVVGERGLRLSSGERQRLAIARVLLQDPDVVILDEATSSFDNLAERDIYRVLNERFRGKKTILLVTHRLTVVPGTDRIFVIDQGRVVETGNHQQLANRPGGLYRRLWEAAQGDGGDPLGVGRPQSETAFVTLATPPL